MGGNSLSKEEILVANMEDLLLSAELSKGDLAVSERLDAIGDIANIAELTKRLISTTQIVFSVGKAWVGLASAVVVGIRTDFDRIKLLFPRSELNPYFNIFREEVIQLLPDLTEEYKLLLPINKIERAESVIKLNDFVNAVRRRSKQEGFINLVCNKARSSNKNQASLSSYISRLFNWRSRLLVIRVDLEYGRGYALGGENQIGYDETDKHRKLFIKDVQYRLCKRSYVGYVWKLEYGLMNSFHYHFLIFLDAAKVRQDVNIARILGEYWQKKVTEGKGRYWNCNAKKKGYRNCGIGEIPYNNPILRRSLEKAASYLVKADYFIRSVIPANRRAFGKGSVISSKQPKRGRPRKN